MALCNIDTLAVNPPEVFLGPKRKSENVGGGATRNKKKTIRFKWGIPSEWGAKNGDVDGHNFEWGTIESP